MSAITEERFKDLTGRRQAHNFSAVAAFDGSEKHGDAAVRLSARVGNPLMDWENDHLRGMLRQNPDTNRWVHSDVCLICPRQNGKSEILLVRCLYGLFVLGEKIVFSAQRWKTGKKIAERMIAIINRRPSLKARLAKKPSLGGGMGSIVLKSGAAIDFITRSEDSGRGFDEIDLLIFDEAYNLDDGAVSAQAPFQLAARDPQTIYASSAVNKIKHQSSHVLTAVRRRGLDKQPGLYFAEHMAPEDMPRDREETWQYANPSYGVIHTFEKIAKLLRGFATPAGRRSFDIEILGRGDWPRPLDEIDSVFTEDDLIIDQTPSLGGSYAIAVDRSHADRQWAIVAARWTTEGLIHLEAGFVGECSTDAMVLMLLAVVAEWDPAVIMIDRRSPAKVLEPLLLAKGIAPEMTTTPDMALACQGMEDDIGDRSVSFSRWPEGELVESICGVTKRFLPQGDFAWDRAEQSIAPAVAATLARLGLQRFGVETPGDGMAGQIGDADDIDDQWADDEFDALEATF